MNYSKSKNELKQAIADTESAKNTNDERMRMAKVNQFEYKFVEVAVFALLAYIVLLAIGATIAKPILLQLFNSLPNYTLPFMVIGVPFLLGLGGAKLISKHFDIKNRIKAFSKAHTEKEKIEEEIRYQIELEKINAQNDVKEQAIELLDKDKDIVNALTHDYIMLDKRQFDTKDQTEKKLEKLEEMLANGYQMLDKIVIKEVINERFRNVRWGKFVYPFLTALLTGGLFMIFNATPFFILDNIPNKGLPTAMLSLLGFGTILGGTLAVKRNRDCEQAFNNINQDLGEDAMPSKSKDLYVEEYELDEIYDKTVTNISIIEAERQKIKRRLEYLDGDHETRDDNDSASLEENILLQPNLSQEKQAGRNEVNLARTRKRRK